VALEDGDQVAFMPPVSGGGPSGLTDGAIDVEALQSDVAATGHGALVTFVGRARGRADDGREVLELEYEAYPEMATNVLGEIVTEAEGRWMGCAVAVVHRVGLVPIGEAAVAIVTAAPHRSEAYEANRFVIEAIKERLPIWKRERFADGTEWKRPGA
jgi:molybdopterin synthase catalytic subunit